MKLRTYCPFMPGRVFMFAWPLKESAEVKLYEDVTTPQAYMWQLPGLYVDDQETPEEWNVKWESRIPSRTGSQRTAPLETWKWSNIRNGVRFLRVMDPMLLRTRAPAPCQAIYSTLVKYWSKLAWQTSGVSTARTFLTTLRETWRVDIFDNEFLFRAGDEIKDKMVTIMNDKSTFRNIFKYLCF